MSLIDKAIEAIAPGLALNRARSRKALSILTEATSRYDAATTGNRGKSWRPTSTDADAAAAGQRARLAFVARDMVRNTVYASRGQQIIVNNVVGDGIIPKVNGKDATAKASLLAAIQAHLDTTAIDATGRNNLYGLQRLAMNCIVDSGEVIIRYRARETRDNLPLPFQIEVLEPDYLDSATSGIASNGNEVIEGIEFDKIGRRVAYYLHATHPGSVGRYSARGSSRVPAENVLHLYRQDRPGQRRGVSWFAAIALHLQDMADHQDAQLMRQKIAACFAAFRVSLDADPDGAAQASTAGLTGQLVPGRIQTLAPGEDIRFAAPPAVTGYDEFTRNVLRAVAAGLGITYEALTGDMSMVNFSSARMARMEMDRNVSSWQWVLMVPQMLQPIGKWTTDAWALREMRRNPGLSLEWVPPHRTLVDPTREIPALAAKVRAGFASRSGIVRQLGYDPEQLNAEIESDAAEAKRMGLVFDSDPKNAAPAIGTKDDGDE